MKAESGCSVVRELRMELPHFDELLEMAKQRPEALEALREEMVEYIITSARTDCQRKLRGLQFKVDMTRARAKTPLAACIKISQLMHESLAELRYCLNERYDFALAEAEAAPVSNAEVISLEDYRSRA
ncbi:DUF3135 domain-containing protein [Hahella sp. KA22]|nr:DUF3135 domain-containing protein [Hahella sp. KA22]MBU6952472.1 DUF3135 domain-containing protein [Hahella sp. HN01]QAY56827.1 DUF3135 domain-containing protein [Hahella sp. KA22]